MTLPGVAPLPKNADPNRWVAMPRPRNSRAAVTGDTPLIWPGFMSPRTMLMSLEVSVTPAALDEVNVRRWAPWSSVPRLGVMSDGSSTESDRTRPVSSRSVAR